MLLLWNLKCECSHQMVTPTLTAIQAKQLSVATVLQKMELVREAVLSQRRDSAFSQFWSDCMARAKQLDVDPPRLRRPARQPRRLGGGNEWQPQTPGSCCLDLFWVRMHLAPFLK